MKRILLSLGIITVLGISLSSCTSQRDCQGGKHYRLKNGIYL